MKIAILILGILGSILLLFSVYSYMTTSKHFRPIAYSFIVTAVATFILVIIKNLRENIKSGKNRKE